MLSDEVRREVAQAFHGVQWLSPERAELIERIASDAARAAERALVERVEAVCDDIDAFMGYRSPTADRFRAALRPEAATTEGAVAEPDAWVDRHGDVWRLGNDGLLWTEETAPFPREHVEKKWGPLRPVADLAARPSSTRGGDDSE